jgi:predicted Zn-ribbon and HTH transcriptional regulator
MIARLICYLRGHKCGNACGNLPGDPVTVRRIRCPRCKATWTRKVKA